MSGRESKAREAGGIGVLVGEMSSARFGDTRLTRRLPRLMEKLAQSPEKSLPSLLDESELESAYRFFSNDSVTPTRILEPHVDATLRRIEEAGVAIAIHDTTTMAFDPDGARRGLGRIRSSGQAFFAHVTLAVSADGQRRPLGTLALRSHVRDETTASSDEHGRWLQQMLEVEARSRSVPPIPSSSTSPIASVSAHVAPRSTG